MDIIKKTALFDFHKKINGNIVNFAGFYLPIMYTSIQDEHNAVRNNIGVFDVSHMGNFTVTAPDKKTAADFFNYLLPNDYSDIYPGKCIYSPLLNEKGGTIDDLIVMSLTETDYHIIVNASNIDKDFDWINSVGKNKNISLKNDSDIYSIIAIQGPNAINFIDETFGFNSKNLKSFHITKDQYKNETVMISRTGYTGEDGAEIILKNSTACDMMNDIYEKQKKYDIKFCGLGSRDTLRLEAALPLYGHELDDTLSPLQTNVHWSVKLNKSSDFIGKKALLEAKNKYSRILTGFEIAGRSIPRNGMSILDKAEKTIGIVTSGSFAPTLSKNIGLAYIEKDNLNTKQELFIQIRNRIEKIELLKLPFYKRKK